MSSSSVKSFSVVFFFSYRMWRLVPRALSTNVSKSIYFTNLDHRLVPIPSLVTNKPSPVPRLWLQIHHLSFWITHFKNPHKFAKARALTWNSMLHSVVIHVPAGSHANYWNKRNCLHKKRIIPTGLVWYTNMAAVSLFWNINMAAGPHDVMCIRSVDF